MVRKFLLSILILMLLQASSFAGTLVFVSQYCSACGPVKQVALELKFEGYDITINTDNRDLNKEYRIYAVPTIVFERGGVEVYRHVGAILKSELVRLINYYGR